MKVNTTTSILTLFILVCFSGIVLAQDSSKTSDQEQQSGQHFVDEDGDGYNDNAPDHDGDGIPNGLDPDWQKLKKEKRKKRFVDLDGDGIDDNLLEENGEQQMGRNKKRFQQEKESSMNQQQQQSKGATQQQKQKRNGKK